MVKRLSMEKREYYQLQITTAKSGLCIWERPASIKKCLRLRDFYLSLYDCQYKIVDIEGNIYHEGGTL